jgi:hypothetical protein
MYANLVIKNSLHVFNFYVAYLYSIMLCRYEFVTYVQTCLWQGWTADTSFSKPPQEVQTSETKQAQLRDSAMFLNEIMTDRKTPENHK